MLQRCRRTQTFPVPDVASLLRDLKLSVWNAQSVCGTFKGEVILSDVTLSCSLLREAWLAEHPEALSARRTTTWKGLFVTPQWRLAVIRKICCGSLGFFWMKGLKMLLQVIIFNTISSFWACKHFFFLSLHCNLPLPPNAPPLSTPPTPADDHSQDWSPPSPLQMKLHLAAGLQAAISPL